MKNVVIGQYNQTGKSTRTDLLGMREMQARAYARRTARHLLIKAPPASGKSRALMYIALDKLINQGLQKVIVSVPERSIGASFASTDLKAHGFFANWDINDEDNLCSPGGESGKVESFIRFMDGGSQILICTHATLRFAFEKLQIERFNNCLVAIDEFHHVSADVSSRLGELLRDLLAGTDCHVVAMTGSYFRGDTIPILRPEDEQKFTKVTYNYFEQLNGYTYLKTLGIGYHFYSGKYTSAIGEVLDTDKKTILHIPNVNSGESTKEKYDEVDLIIDSVGEVIGQDKSSGVINVKRKSDGKVIRVADLVNDDQLGRDKIIGYLRNISKPEDIDLIIALGMAKEGFDWPYCEHALTVGYRGSLTEIVQIIGRTTRDSENKSHAQFTNLIAEPDAAFDEVKNSVNNMLKAISCSLLMEQIIAPNFKFKTKNSNDDISDDNIIFIEGIKAPSSKRVEELIHEGLEDVKASILQDERILSASLSAIEPEVVNKVLIPKVIQRVFPDLTEEETEELRQHVVADLVVKRGGLKSRGGNRFLELEGKLVNIDELNIDLIDSINPFQNAFEILSKSLDSNTLRLIYETVEISKLDLTIDEAIILWPKINVFFETQGYEPSLESREPGEKRLAEALRLLRNASHDYDSE